MRKIILLFLLLTVTFSVRAQFPEGFETSVPPSGWTSFIGTNGEGTSQNWEESTTAASGSKAAYVRYENVTNSAEDWLVTPQFTPSSSANILTFKQRQGFGSDYGTSYTIRVSTASQTTHADFTIVDTQAEGDFGTVYSTHNVDLSAYNGTPIYVAFVMENDDGDNWFIDDVDVIENASPPNCATNPTPADMATDVAVTSGNITIAWDAPTTGDAATGYEIFWGTTSGSLTSLGTISATTVNINNVNYSTTYYWMAVPQNVGGSATGCAEWSFTTEAAPPPPPNDTLAGAIPITPSAAGTGCTTATFTLPFSTDRTTDSGMDGTCSTTDTGLDQFFTWTATTDGLLWNDSAPGNPGIIIRDTSGTEITCAGTFADDDTILSGWTIGDDLIIQIYDYGTSVSDVAFCLEEYTLPPAPECATNLMPTDTATDVDATGSSITLSWDAPASGATPTDYEIFWGTTSGSLSSLGTTTNTTVNITNVNYSTTYYWMLVPKNGPTSAVGCAELSFTTEAAPPPPSNDNCVNATGVGLFPFNETIDATFATNNNGFISECGGMNDGVWYTFTTVNAGTIDIAITGVTGWDPEVALYSGSCGTFICVDSADSGGSGVNETLSGVAVSANTQYWVNIGYWSNTTDNPEGPFTIDISTSDTTTIIPIITWTGTTGIDWATTGNWDTGVVPTASDNVIIPSGLTNYPTAASAVNVNNITLEAGASMIAQSTVVGNITYKRTLSVADKWYLVAAPVVGETIENLITNHTFATGTSPNIGLAPYDNTQTDINDRWNYQELGSMGPINNGQGYSVRLATPSDISFTGTFNTNDVTQAIAIGAGDAFNLIGNPYPSYINSGTFLTTNTSNLTSQTIWIWNQATGMYDTKVTDDAFKVAPGQGFFVECGTAGTITFEESTQSNEATDTFQRQTRSEIELTITDETTSRYAKIYYVENATTGFDNGYDGKLFGGVQNSFEIYSHLLADNQGGKYQIQSLSNADYESMIVPMGVKADAGKEITFSVKTMNLPTDVKVFLEDKEANIFTRLDEANTEYNVTLSEALDGVGRFYIHTSASALTVGDATLSTVNIYKSDISTLRIVGLPQGNTTVKLFSVEGKEVLHTSFTTNGIKDISLSRLSASMYIVEIQTEIGKLNKKIILEE
ncbi:MAG: choice-of-anchor J domain-containing protein [Polaribacter sp.]